MALLSWSDEYLIGEATIDSEHKGLFVLVNDFHSRWQAKGTREEIALVLHKLVLYAEEHFRHEEAVMDAAGYPRLAEHHTVHADMFEQIFKLREEYEQQDNHLEQDTMRFVRNWLVNHIVQHDFEFRAFLSRSAKGG
jgi:hemerythrin